MVGFVDEIIGLCHFLGDRAPKNTPPVDPRPRPFDPWRRAGRVLLSKVTAGVDLHASVQESLASLGRIEEVIGRGDRVLVKPNFNSPDPYPGSTDLAFLEAVLELLLEAGAKVTVAESSGGIWRPTKKVFRKLGVVELMHHLGVELVAFDEVEDWVKVRIAGDYLDTVTVPRLAYEAEKIVYLPCLKTHNLSRFSGALKLAVGFMHPGERRALHARFLEQKVAEISLCWQPNLIVMDGRKIFVSGGPDKGQLAAPGLLLASGDLVAIDVEAMRVILAYEAKNRLETDPWQSLQIVTALKHGLGSGKDGYVLVE